MRRTWFSLLGIVAFYLGAIQAWAGAPEWKFDRAHCRFYFDVRHIYATVRGDFPDYEGRFLFDPDNPGESKFEIAIKVKSVTTKNRKRDNHLRSSDFFAVSKYPLMTFKSTRISHLGGNRYQAEGDLTIKDVTKKVVVPFTYLGQRENPFNRKEMVSGFEARFTINRLKYHVGNGKYYKMGVTGKDVIITITLEMVRHRP